MRLTKRVFGEKGLSEQWKHRKLHLFFTSKVLSPIKQWKEHLKEKQRQDHYTKVLMKAWHTAFSAICYNCVQGIGVALWPPVATHSLLVISKLRTDQTRQLFVQIIESKKSSLSCFMPHHRRRPTRMAKNTVRRKAHDFNHKKYCCYSQFLKSIPSSLFY